VSQGEEKEEGMYLRQRISRKDQGHFFVTAWEKPCRARGGRTCAGRGVSGDVYAVASDAHSRRVSGSSTYPPFTVDRRCSR
jgi:hypothetical protein